MLKQPFLFLTSLLVCLKTVQQIHALEFAAHERALRGDAIKHVGKSELFQHNPYSDSGLPKCPLLCAGSNEEV